MTVDSASILASDIIPDGSAVARSAAVWSTGVFWNGSREVPTTWLC